MATLEAGTTTTAATKRHCLTEKIQWRYLALSARFTR